MAKCSTDGDALNGFLEFNNHISEQMKANLWCCQSMLKNYDHGVKATRLELHLKSLTTIHRTIGRLLEDCVPIVKEELVDFKRSQKHSKTGEKSDISKPQGKAIGYTDIQICGGIPPLGEESEPEELS